MNGDIYIKRLWGWTSMCMWVWDGVCVNVKVLKIWRVPISMDGRVVVRMWCEMIGQVCMGDCELQQCAVIILNFPPLIFCIPLLFSFLSFLFFFRLRFSCFDSPPLPPLSLTGCSSSASQRSTFSRPGTYQWRYYLLCVHHDDECHNNN